jgi:hypothetical protein
LGASLDDEWPPNTQTVPTTNHTAKKQSSAILNLSTIIPTLPDHISISVVHIPMIHICFCDVSSIQRQYTMTNKLLTLVVNACFHQVSKHEQCQVDGQHNQERQITDVGNHQFIKLHVQDTSVNGLSRKTL